MNIEYILYMRYPYLHIVSKLQSITLYLFVVVVIFVVVVVAGCFLRIVFFK